jgi:hypothetical protein
MHPLSLGARMAVAGQLYFYFFSFGDAVSNSDYISMKMEAVCSYDTLVSTSTSSRP